MKKHFLQAKVFAFVIAGLLSLTVNEGAKASERFNGTPTGPEKEGIPSFIEGSFKDSCTKCKYWEESYVMTCSCGTNQALEAVKGVVSGGLASNWTGQLDSSVNYGVCPSEKDQTKRYKPVDGNVVEGDKIRLNNINGELLCDRGKSW